MKDFKGKEIIAGDKILHAHMLKHKCWLEECRVVKASEDSITYIILTGDYQNDKKLIHTQKSESIMLLTRR